MLNNFLKKIPWQIKLTALMVIMSIIPGLIVSYNILDIIKNELKFNINEQLKYSSETISNNINITLKKNIELLNFTSSYLNKDDISGDTKVNLLISQLEKTDNLLSILVLLKKDGKFEEAAAIQKEVIELSNGKKTQLTKEFKDNVLSELGNANIDVTYVGKPKFNKQLLKWTSVISIPLPKTFFPSGCLVGVFDLSDLEVAIQNSIVNRIGTVFISDSLVDKFLTTKIITDIPVAITNDIIKILQSKTDIRLVNNYKDKNLGNFVCSYVKTSIPKWLVVSIVNEDAAYATINETLIFFTVFFATTIILSIFVALLFSKHLSKPIIDMANISGKISEGDYDVNINYIANDSIGFLGSSLAKMGKQLKQSFTKIADQNKQLEDYSKNLEKKVEERTAQLNESNEELKKAYHRVLELNQEKNEFLGIAAHDLKNPLTAISSFAEILKTDKDLDQEQFEDFLNEIIKASGRMFSIVKNLLDVNAIEQGKLNVKMTSVSVRLLIDEMTAQFSEALQKKNMEIIESFEIDNPEIFADFNIALQVIQNILSNAIKFSQPQKKIYITVRQTSDAKNIEISIKDEGPGFTENDKKKLFQKFAKLSARPTGGEHSTGLGLSIVKKLVEMMGGTIRLESEHGKGADFILTFPKVIKE